jgi:hypothetical protein
MVQYIPCLRLDNEGHMDDASLCNRERHGSISSFARLMQSNPIQSFPSTTAQKQEQSKSRNPGRRGGCCVFLAA